MLYFSVLSALLLLAAGSLAQPTPTFPPFTDPTVSYYAPGIPIETPLPGNYGNYLRPQVHYSPSRYFMNDPNGMHIAPDGTWHIYFQYNPTDPVAGNVHWGHAASQDGYTWTNQKIAIWPPNDYTSVFSGSAVIDVNNTSGFFPDQDNGVVAMYTLAEYPNGTAGNQYQAIAYSRDGGYTFEAYEGNPVINRYNTQFRDPYVHWYAPGGYWVMVLAHSVEFKVEFFTSPDLKEWTAQSNLTRYGVQAVQYECPNLIELPMEGQDEPVWVLQLSVNPGGPLGGSTAQYFPGAFNGTHFEPYDSLTRFTDFGKDSYAGQFFNGIPPGEEQIVMNWASNWQYTNLVPTGNEEYGQFRSAMSVPRCVSLANTTSPASEQTYNWISKPCAIDTVFDTVLASNDTLDNGTVLVDYRDLESGAIYLEVTISNLTLDNPAGSINFTASSSLTGEYLQGGSVVGGVIWLDRGHTYLFPNPLFTDKMSVNGFFGEQSNGTWSMSALIDNSVLEVFGPKYSPAGTASFFPEAPLDTLRIDVGSLAPGATASVQVWGLTATWLDQADENGTVIGNVTQSNGTNGTSPGGYRRSVKLY
ncbi:glycoside hydrolase family 32 protein [Polychaeton citri CBS 116435]|uniref:Glycoside hydrolase family 32 protein n=1 Tax=Polychaeton citri CBS 116435 TaxID=1314669 RepID=A0A9P4Q2N0_9PEZI|nr:glycoside hydrolase family 32 protein [Polychaeton citri CBS 116435]